MQHQGDKASQEGEYCIPPIFCNVVNRYGCNHIEGQDNDVEKKVCSPQRKVCRLLDLLWLLNHTLKGLDIVAHVISFPFWRPAIFAISSGLTPSRAPI